MIVDFPYFLLALLLLWFPRRGMRLGKSLFGRRRRATQREGAAEPWMTREAGDPRVSFQREFTRFRNYVDLARGGAGSLLLGGGMGIAPCLAIAEGGTHAAARWALALRMGVLLVGVVIQTLRIERGRVTFYPPVFYLAGLSLGLSHLTGAVFAFAMIWALNPAIGSATGFLTMYAVLLIAFGQLFAGGRDLSAIYAGGLCFLPVLLSLLSRRPLVMLSRKTSRAGSG